MWMDNYSKNLKWHCPDVDRGTFNKGLWTGFAVRACTDQNIRMTCCSTDLGSLPAMPDDIFEPQDNIAIGLLRAIFERGDRAHMRFHKSLVFNWKVNNVPLRPDIQDDMTQSEVDGLNRHADALDHLYPLRLIDINCGENMGFARCMKMLSEEKNWEEDPRKPYCEKYTFMFMDCDLFDKCLKVLILIHQSKTSP